MPYVQRGLNSQIVSIFANFQEGYAEEWLEDGDPEIMMQSKEDRIKVLQSLYESDLYALNKAWLAALIADGVGEATRQAAIKAQMEAVSTKLEMDIFSIITED